MMILINGGSSSGKSAFAETLIEEQEKKEEVMAESTGKSMRVEPHKGSPRRNVKPQNVRKSGDHGGKDRAVLR